MQCGMTLTTALSENLPEATALQRWPLHFRKKLSLDYLESDNSSAPASSPQQRDFKLWELAERVWDTLRRNYKEGLPQVEMLAKLTSLMEEEFKNWMNNSSEKLSYLLLIPLFTLSVPAVLILLFAPLLSALGN